MESCKREGAKGLKWSSSEDRMDSKYNGGGAGGFEGEEGYFLRSPLNANGISSRKRNMLQERKVGFLLPMYGNACVLLNQLFSFLIPDSVFSC